MCRVVVKLSRVVPSCADKDLMRKLTWTTCAQLAAAAQQPQQEWAADSGKLSKLCRVVRSDTSVNFALCRSFDQVVIINLVIKFDNRLRQEQRGTTCIIVCRNGWLCCFNLVSFANCNLQKTLSCATFFQDKLCTLSTQCTTKLQSLLKPAT